MIGLQGSARNVRRKRYGAAPFRLGATVHYCLSRRQSSVPMRLSMALVAVNRRLVEEA